MVGKGLERGVCGVGGVVELERGHLLGVWAESTRGERQRRAARESVRDGERVPKGWGMVADGCHFHLVSFLMYFP